MATVKGSKQERMVLRPHRPLRRWLLALVSILLLAGSGLIIFAAGQHYQLRLQKLTPGERTQLQILQEKLVTLERDRLVDEVAIEKARSSIKDLEQQVTRQNKAIAFYRSVMEPGAGKKGLQVKEMTIERLGRENAFRVNWVITQAGKNDKYVQGKTGLRLAVVSAGEQKVLPLNTLVKEMPNMSFKLRYFQNFSVEIDVPQGADVISVEVLAEPTNPKGQPVSRKFEWITQEVLADVGE